MKTVGIQQQQKPFYYKIKKEDVHNSLLDIVNEFEVLPKEKKEFLIKLWLKSYEHGTKVVKLDSFTNPKLMTSKELKDRFYQYPDVSENKLDFIKKIADEDNATIDMILGDSANQENFLLETYESNYIDKSLDVLHSIIVPKGFEQIDISLICQDAFAEGAMKKIDYLAKNTLSALAIKKIKDMQK